MSFLQLERLEKTYPDGTRAVVGIDFAAEAGELVVLLGPSGCGKTTTLRMVAGLELATRGLIRLAGREITRLPPSQRDIGMVFQFYALYPHLSVRDNIGFPLRAAGLATPEIRRRVAALAHQMSLQRLLPLYPRQLSGGDQQKVSLARAMVRRPAIFLMDEPLGTLDADQRLALRELIRAEQLASKVTTLYVTHDQEEAMCIADRIVVMAGGRIRQVGTPAEVYDDPADTFVATFLGSPPMNLLERDGILLGFRPEHVRAGSAAEGAVGFRFRCELTEYLGSEQLAYGTLQDAAWAGREVVWRFPSWDPAPAEGSVQDVYVERARLRYFDSSTGLRRPAP